MRQQTLALIVAATCLASPVAAQEHAHVGAVHFPTSCSAAAQPAFDQALALLHSFEFRRAIDGFRATLATDASCGIAWWGIAMSRWANPMATTARSKAALDAGADAVARARDAGLRTPRERAYVNAVAILFTDVATVPHAARVAAYRDAMIRLADTYPDDHEAALFSAIAIAAAASPTDKTYKEQRRAGAILERLLAVEPNHPGLPHYLIHAYDVPPLANRALAAADRYASVAPDAPHAMHMPSHTYTRVGEWQKSIATNLLSAAAARRDGSTAEELHASDYLTYAYLQLGNDSAARRVVESLPDIERRFDPNAIGGAASGSAGIFALAAIPARYALERSDWKSAVALVPRQTSVLYADAITHVARAIGAGHLRDARTASDEASALRTLSQQLAGEDYWAEQVRIQSVAADAWAAWARGAATEAIRLMHEAADAEDRTEKSSVTPGPVAPAREQLGDMLLASGNKAGALAEYSAVLVREPKRRRALEGRRLAGEP